MHRLAVLQLRISMSAWSVPTEKDLAAEERRFQSTGMQCVCWKTGDWAAATGKREAPEISRDCRFWGALLFHGCKCSCWWKGCAADRRQRLWSGGAYAARTWAGGSTARANLCVAHIRTSCDSACQSSKIWVMMQRIGRSWCRSKWVSRRRKDQGWANACASSWDLHPLEAPILLELTLSYQCRWIHTLGGLQTYRKGSREPISAVLRVLLVLYLHLLTKHLECQFICYKRQMKQYLCLVCEKTIFLQSVQSSTTVVVVSSTELRCFDSRCLDLTRCFANQLIHCAARHPLVPRDRTRAPNSRIPDSRLCSTCQDVCNAPPVEHIHSRGVYML